MSETAKAPRGAALFHVLAMGVAISSGAVCLAVASPMLAVAATPAPAAGPTVKIDNFTFGPAAVTVKVGATVTWVNGDDIPHTVVSQDHVTFKSKVLDSGQSFSFTFAKAGEYAYFCSLHPHMVGKVVVQN